MDNFPNRASYIIVVVGRQTQVLKDVICQGVAQVATVKLQPEELRQAERSQHTVIPSMFSATGEFPLP